MASSDTTPTMVRVRPRAGGLTKAQQFSKAYWGRQYLLDIAAQIARDHIGTDDPHFSATCLAETGVLTAQKVHLEVNHLAKCGLLKPVGRAGRHYFEAVPSGLWATYLALVEDETERLDVAL